MFERFTDKARTAVIAARAEAAERGDQIRPVYLLHALTAGEGVAARALRHGYVGTEHLLLGLIGAAQRNPRGDFSPQTLKGLGIDPAQARQRVLDELRRAST